MAKKTVLSQETIALFNQALGGDVNSTMAIMQDTTMLKEFTKYKADQDKQVEKEARIKRVEEIYSPSVSDNGILFASVDLSQVGELTKSGKSRNVGLTLDGKAEPCKFHVIEHNGKKYWLTMAVQEVVE